METVFKRAQDMTPAELRAAKRLTLPLGQMWPMLQDCRSNRYPRITGDVGLVYEGTRLVCWGLAFKDETWGPRDSRTVYFYTDSRYRRKGYATTLFKKMKVRYKSFHVSPWDRNSAGFFDKQKINTQSRSLVTAIMNGMWDD